MIERSLVGAAREAARRDTARRVAPLLTVERRGSLDRLLEVDAEGRGAQGVVLTEVSVHPDLAAEAGLQLTTLFADGASLGETMLHVRRALLARANPCGLLYCTDGGRRLRVRPPPTP